MRSLIAVVAVVALSVGCTKVYTQRERQSSILEPTPTPIPNDRIEFRVLGNVNVPITIRHSNSLDGLTLLGAVNLPYFAAIDSKSDSIFLLLEAGIPAATTPAPTTTVPAVQVQIIVNGKLFREAYSSGATAFAQASGTYRR